jgi:hypothetical protein
VANVRVEIERLVLTGWPLGTREAAAVQAAVEAELGRLFAAEGAEPSASGATDRMAAAPVTWAPGGDVAALGMQVAQSVYGSLGQ